MEEEIKKFVTPEITVTHDYLNTELMIEVDVAGAHKESIDLDMGEHGFCLRADGEKVRYDSCATLAHEIIPDKARAKFEAGFLTINVPFKERVRGCKVAVE